MFWRKKKTKNKSANPFLAGVLVSALVFFLGFFVMLCMYEYWQRFSGSFYPELKGLFDYKASLYGDSICLPVISGAGITYIMIYNDLIKGKKQRLCRFLVASVSGIIGIATQISWYLNDDTIPNWSIPEVHHFNCAGKYHAVFFVMMSFIIAYIVTCVVQSDFIIAKKGLPNWSDNSKRYIAYYFCQTLIWLMGILFLHFHYVDDYSEKYQSIIIVSIVSVTTLIVLFVEKKITYRKKAWFYPLIPVVYAVIISTIISIICLCQKPQCDIALLIAGSFCTSLYVYNSENKLKMIGMFIFFALFDCLMQISISNALIGLKWNNAFVLFIICFIIPVLISWTDYCLNNKKITCKKASHLRALIYTFIIKAGLIILSEIRCISRVLIENQMLKQVKILVDLIYWIEANRYTIGAVLITCFILMYVKTTFPIIQTMEYNVGSKYTSKQLETAKISQYAIYFFAYFAALILLWKMLDFQVEKPMEIQTIIKIFALMSLLSLLCFAAFRIKKMSISLSLFVLSVIILILFIISKSLQNNIFYILNSDTSLLWRDCIFIIYISCVLTVFSAWSIIANTSLIRQKQLDKEVVIVASVFGMLSGIGYYVAASFLFVESTLESVLFLFIITIMTLCLIPFLCVWKMNPEGNIGLVDNYARSGVAQDGFLYGIIATSSALITAKCSRLLVQGEIVLVLIFILPTFVYGLSALWNYCIQNNNNHLEKKQRLYDKLIKDCSSDEEKERLRIQMNNLYIHLKVQNDMAFLITLPYSIIYYIVAKLKGDE